VTLGGNDGVRLYVDGVLTIDGYADQTYTTYTETIFLNGLHQFVIEYYEVDGANQVSFETTFVASEGGGLISGDQTICASTIDPTAFLSVQDAGFCSGTTSYQWQTSPDGTGWTDILGANSETYDIPSSMTPGTFYYRRQATNGITTVTSNTLTVVGDSPAGDQITFGTGNWIGYIYSGADNFTNDYRGFYLENEVFDQDFNGDAVVFSITGCDFLTEDFSVHYRSIQDFSLDCGAWQITIGGDDGVRLFVDGELVIDGYSDHSYQTYQATIYLDQSHQFILEYYDTSPANRVSFSKVKVADGIGGEISAETISCTTDPDPITSEAPGESCSAPVTYQWQTGTDGVLWSDIPGATNITYDPPVTVAGTYYFRRVAYDGVDSYNSNSVSIDVDPVLGDQTTPGDDSWIGYVYVGADNFSSSDYRGFITEPLNFDESFCGSNCRTSIDGCDITTDDFTIRFLNTQTFDCGAYQFTFGSDDGVRLTIDGVIEDYFFDEGYSGHSYETYTEIVYLSGGDYNLTLDYFDNNFANRVSFSSTYLGLGYGGEIVGDLYSCDTSIDPPQLTSAASATFCFPGIVSYQWQESYDGQGWSDIVLATSDVYDPPAVTSSRYYRRQASSGTTVVYSNVVTVTLDPPVGDQSSYGINSWIGYVYEGTGTFNSTDYHGYILETTIFDENFCDANACTFETNGCDILTENFSVRFQNRQFFPCGYYELTIGGDDGVRLSIDGNEVLNDFTNHNYRTTSTTIFLDGTYDLVLDYYDATLSSRVSFDFTMLSSGGGGTVNGDQTSCLSGSTFDPAPFTNVNDAGFCAGTFTYQWEESTDGNSWTLIAGATSEDYDETSVPSPGTYFYRRSASNGSTVVYSNTITVTALSPTGDRTTYGMDEWIGYVYDGANSFDPSNYLGYFTRPAMFDESFCTPSANICIFPLSECDLSTETFTVQFRMSMDFAPASYTFTIGGDDGVRLYVNGNLLINGYQNQPYTTYQGTIDLSGQTELVLDYYDATLGNRVSFDYTSVPLPVTWYYFNGYHENGSNILEWHTASEINNVGFEVERSWDGKAFDKVGWVEGHGTTNEKNEYVFIDKSLKTGWMYYRLKQIDYDGKFEYSRLIPVFVDVVDDIQIYPNPMSDYLYLSRTDKDVPVIVTITNVLAQRTYFLSQDVMQPNRFVNSERLIPGLYSVKIDMGGKIYVRKMIVE
jgi:hypothetical protein